MINWLKSWANSIIVAVIIAVIFELIIPNGRNKKYIKIVINLYVLFAILNPIVSKVTNIDTLDISKYESTLKTDNSIYISSKLDSEDIINTTLKKGIKDDISKKLLLYGYKTSDINIGINNNANKIDWITLSITKDNKSRNENKSEDKKETNNIDINSNISINKVEKINIDAKENNSTNNMSGNSNKEDSTLRTKDIDKVKKIISEEYNISKDNIKVN